MSIKNETLIKRICMFLAQCYALSNEEVWEIYTQTGSLDKTIEKLSETR
jgi:hypothetical protein